MKDLDLNIVAFIIGTICIIGIITGAMHNYNVKQDELFARNMETAIGKGVDPIAVRCAYYNTAKDMCIAYIMSHKTQ